MSGTQMNNEHATQIPTAATVDLKLEVVVIPVSDVERAKRFYGSLGWRWTPISPSTTASGSCSSRRPARRAQVQFGTNMTSAAPGSAQALYLVVSDVEAARDELAVRGAKISEVFHAGRRERSSSTTARAVESAGPRPTMPAIARSRPSAIQTATDGCCKRSGRVFPDEDSATATSRH